MRARGTTLASLTRSIVGQRDAFTTPRSWAEILALFAQPEDLTEDKIAASVFLGSEAAMMAEIIPHLLAKGGNDGKAGAALQQCSIICWRSGPAAHAKALSLGRESSDTRARAAESSPAATRVARPRWGRARFARSGLAAGVGAPSALLIITTDTGPAARARPRAWARPGGRLSR